MQVSNLSFPFPSLFNTSPYFPVYLMGPSFPFVMLCPNEIPIKWPYLLCIFKLDDHIPSNISDHIYIYIHTLLLDDICIPKIMNLSLFQTIMIRWFSSFCLYFNNNKNKTHYDLFGFQPFYLFVTFSFCKIKKKKKTIICSFFSFSFLL